MSGLAQLLSWQGYEICGSDRGLQEPGKAELYKCLRNQGMHLYEQDGSGITQEKPDMLIVSTAVEPGNPDLVAGSDIPVLHRAAALSAALSATGAKLLAVAGSCGKTSVTGWLASALKALGERIVVVNGGYYSRNLQGNYPGNFYADENPTWAVAEIDESDKSISQFSPDYGLLLNVGNDHYGEDELKSVFSDFLGRCKQGAVTDIELAELAEKATCPLGFFSVQPNENAIYPDNYSMDSSGISFKAPFFGEVHSNQSGFHSACNASAVLAMLKILNLQYSSSELALAISDFSGIKQRFEIMGTNAKGLPLINDYAHNPEKLAAALNTAHDRFNGPVVAFFQPHGFKPLGFMREKLIDILAETLHKGDIFCMLPVFYAGGTANFSPTSDEVAKELADKVTGRGITVAAISRNEAADIINKASDAKAILVMGARDSSLRPWTATL